MILGRILRVAEDVEVRRVDARVVGDIGRFAVARSQGGRRRKQGRCHQNERSEGRGGSRRSRNRFMTSSLTRQERILLERLRRRRNPRIRPARLSKTFLMYPSARPMAAPGDDDRDLMARIDARDADALGLLYDRHAARLLGLAERILGSGGEAEEVLQEVFLHVWRAAPSYDASRGSVLAWLLVATRSRSIDRLRARRPMSRGELKRLDDIPESASPVDVERDSAAAPMGRGLPLGHRGAARGAATRARARLLRGAHPRRDRRAHRDAARHRQDARPIGLDETPRTHPAVWRRWTQ